jgi:hypothetical protein
LFGASKSLDTFTSALQSADVGVADAESELKALEEEIRSGVRKTRGEQVSSAVIGKKLVRLDADTADALAAARTKVSEATESYNRRLKTLQNAESAIKEERKVAQDNFEFMAKLDNLTEIMDEDDFTLLAYSAGLPIEYAQGLYASKKGNDAVAKVYVSLVESGRFDLDNVPASVRNQVVTQVDVSKIPLKGKAPKAEEVEIPTFENFLDEFMTTPQGQEIIKRAEEQVRQSLPLEERKRIVGEAVRSLYDETVGEQEKTATKAKDFFTKTQLAKGAANAGMSITEFGNLSADDANEFIQKVSETTDLSDEEFLELLNK